MTLGATRPLADCAIKWPGAGAGPIIRCVCNASRTVVSGRARARGVWRPPSRLAKLAPPPPGHTQWAGRNFSILFALAERARWPNLHAILNCGPQTNGRTPPARLSRRTVRPSVVAVVVVCGVVGAHSPAAYMCRGRGERAGAYYCYAYAYARPLAHFRARLGAAPGGARRAPRHVHAGRRQTQSGRPPISSRRRSTRARTPPS